MSGLAGAGRTKIVRETGRSARSYARFARFLDHLAPAAQALHLLRTSRSDPDAAPALSVVMRRPGCSGPPARACLQQGAAAGGARRRLHPLPFRPVLSAALRHTFRRHRPGRARRRRSCCAPRCRLDASRALVRRLPHGARQAIRSRLRRRPRGSDVRSARAHGRAGAGLGPRECPLQQHVVPRRRAEERQSAFPRVDASRPVALRFLPRSAARAAAPAAHRLQRLPFGHGEAGWHHRSRSRAAHRRHRPGAHGRMHELSRRSIAAAVLHGAASGDAWRAGHHGDRGRRAPVALAGREAADIDRLQRVPRRADRSVARRRDARDRIRRARAEERRQAFVGSRRRTRSARTATSATRAR